MPPLTTPARVRDRLGADAAQLPDALLEGFIADQQAYVEAALRRAWKEGDPGFALAGSVVADLAAAMALARLAGADDSLEYRLGKLDVRRRGQREGRGRALDELRARARQGLDALRAQGAARRFVLVDDA